MRHTITRFISMLMVLGSAAVVPAKALAQQDHAQHSHGPPQRNFLADDTRRSVSAISAGVSRASAQNATAMPKALKRPK